MIDLVPVKSYETIFNAFVGVIVFIMVVHSFVLSNFQKRQHVHLQFIVIVFFLFTWLFLGFRPISYAFGDMGNYNRSFEMILLNENVEGYEFLFKWLMKFCANYLNASWFFFICFTVYLFPFYIALKRWFNSNWIWPFILMVSLFSFYSYGVNGIRNGMGTSVFLLGLSYRGPFRWFLFFVAYNLHASLLLPIVASVFFIYFKDVKYYLLGWVICLIVTILIPSISQTLSATGLFNDKISEYVSIDLNEVGMGKAGFRLDFLLFGLLPILVGILFRYKLKMKDVLYDEFFSIYLTANAFWLLLIRLPFSNRFAYLSWFLYGLMIAYPFVKYGHLLSFSNRYFSLLLAGLFVFSVTLF